MKLLRIRSSNLDPSGTLNFSKHSSNGIYLFIFIQKPYKLSPSPAIYGFPDWQNLYSSFSSSFSTFVIRIFRNKIFYHRWMLIVYCLQGFFSSVLPIPAVFIVETNNHISLQHSPCSPAFHAHHTHFSTKPGNHDMEHSIIHSFPSLPTGLTTFKSKYLNRYPLSIFPTPWWGTFTNSFWVQGRYAGESCFCWQGSFLWSSSMHHHFIAHLPNFVLFTCTVFQSGPSGLRIACVTVFHKQRDSYGPWYGTSKTFFGSTVSLVTSRKRDSCFFDGSVR